MNNNNDLFLMPSKLSNAETRKMIFKPHDLLMKALVSWYWIFVAGVLGGILGWGSGFLMPAQYQAIATIGIDIDYSRTLPLDDTSKRQALDRVRAFLVSDQLLKETLDRLATETGGEIFFDSYLDLRSRLGIGQKQTQWELSTVADNPETATMIVKIWAQNAILGLEEAQAHAYRVLEYQKLFYDIGCKLDEDPTGTSKAVWLCNRDAPVIAPDELIQAIQSEASLSFGILPALSFSMLQEAATSGTPIIWGRGIFILFGTLTGLMLGLFFVVWRE